MVDPVHQTDLIYLVDLAPEAGPNVSRHTIDDFIQVWKKLFFCDLPAVQLLDRPMRCLWKVFPNIQMHTVDIPAGRLSVQAFHLLQDPLNGKVRSLALLAGHVVVDV